MAILDRTHHGPCTLTVTELDGQFMAQLTVKPYRRGIFEAVDIRPHMADRLCKALDKHGGYKFSTTGGDPMMDTWSIKAEVVKS